MDFEKLYAAMQQKAKKPNYEDSINSVIAILVKSLNTIHGVDDSYKSLKIKRVRQNNLRAIEFHCDDQFILGVILKDNGEVLVDLEPTVDNDELIQLKDSDKEPITKAVEQIIEGSDNFQDVEGAFAKKDDNDEFKDIIVKIINTLSDVPYTSKFDNLHVCGIGNHLGFFDKGEFIISLIYKDSTVICSNDITSKLGSGIHLTGVSKALAEKVYEIVKEQKGSNKNIQFLTRDEALKGVAAMMADLLGNKLFKL